MSKEKTLQSVFDDACNDIDKIVGRYVKHYLPMVSKNEGRDGYMVSLRAQCRKCLKPIMASISTTEDHWAYTLIRYFIQRAEFHQKAEHKIITDFMYVPKTPIQHKKGS